MSCCSTGHFSHRKRSGRWWRDGAAAPQDPAMIYFSSALFWSTSVSYTLQLAPGGTLWKSTGFWGKVQRFMSQPLRSLARHLRTHILEPVRGLPQKQAGDGNLSSWSSTWWQCLKGRGKGVPLTSNTSRCQEEQKAWTPSRVSTKIYPALYDLKGSLILFGE